MKFSNFPSTYDPKRDYYKIQDVNARHHREYRRHQIQYNWRPVILNNNDIVQPFINNVRNIV